MRLLLVSFLATYFVGQAQAGCVAHSPPRRAHLIELYTSEGCSSCPPADRWLASLSASDTLVPLAFHVDYWDSLGWRDRFDDPRFTRRQSELAARAEQSAVYTPETALDGHEWRSLSGQAPPEPTAAPLANLLLDVAPGAQTHARLTVDPLQSLAGYRAYFAVTEDGLSSDVRAGENRGVQLRHEHVVRAFSGPLALEGAQADWSLPADLRIAHATVIAFVQNPTTGTVAQVVRQPLATCDRN
jgi:hypothetical protein